MRKQTALQSDLFSHLSDDEKVRLSHVSWPTMRPYVRGVALEIGCYKGETSVWLLSCDVTNLTVIDTFIGGAELSEGSFLPGFLENVKGLPVEVLVGTSIEKLSWLVVNNRKFDFIYIDGSHHSQDVLIDAVLSFNLLSVGGYMIFDDYVVEFSDKDPFMSPRPAIDFFLACYANRLDPRQVDYQMVVKKLK